MTAWGLAIASFTLLAVIWRRTKPNFLWIIKPILAAFGACAFSQTDWGQTLAGWALAALDLVGGWFGVPGPIVAGILVTALVIIVVLDIAADRVANAPAIGALLVLPLLFLVAAGPIAQGGREIAGNVTDAGTSSVGRLVGGG